MKRNRHKCLSCPWGTRAGERKVMCPLPRCKTAWERKKPKAEERSETE